MREHPLDYARPDLARGGGGAALGWLSLAVSAAWVTLAATSAMTGWRVPLWAIGLLNPVTALAAGVAGLWRGDGGEPVFWAVFFNGMVVLAIAAIAAALAAFAAVLA